MTTAPEDRIRQISATPRTTERPITPKSSVPKTPVNRNVDLAPVQVNPNTATLTPEQYPMAEIVTNTGEKVMVYTGGPLSGQDKDGNFPIQFTGAAPITGGGSGTGTGSTFTATDGKVFTNELAFATYQASLNTQATTATTAAQEAAAESERKRREGQSAYSLLFSEFDQKGLGALVEPLKQFIQEGLSEAEFTLRLRETDAYKKRFAANAQRVAKGLRALSEAEYVLEEDKYQDVMSRYGLPESYYARGEMGKQEGFEKLISGGVSPLELEDRISIAQKRVLNANPEVMAALKQFYPDISNADILAYTLDPKNAIENIKRKVTTAEIGGAALQAGLQTGVNRADVLQAAGVTKESAQEGFGTIAGGLQRGSQLASIYGEDPYTQEVAETEVFKLSGAQGARKQRQKITGLEKATFGGQSGITSGALARDRAGGY